MRQKPVVAVIVGAIMVLSGGVAFAASETSGGSSHLSSQMPAAKWSSATISVPPTTPGAAPTATTPSTAATPTTAPSTTAAPATTAASATPAPAPPAPPAAQPPISYTVRQGDTLSTIAAWFKLHGYQALYQANMAVIGANPNLIFPGQTITIANGTLTMSAP
ncbi:MAG: LysM peptidoglycan-binding domain-containing protein [Actinomycetota bacterium]|nr:LysM peptidoglycan-binding domain-containing protein [Actinomycetota bacterium]